MGWIETIATVAPTVATALGGPLAGTAVQMISSALGIAPDETAVAQALAAADPDTLAKIKEVEANFKTEMRRLGIEEEKLHAEDRNSARQREIALKDHAPKILAGLVVIGFFGVQVYLMLFPLPEGARELLLRTLGSLDGALMMVLSYYFGSSNDRSFGK